VLGDVDLPESFLDSKRIPASEAQVCTGQVAKVPAARTSVAVPLCAPGGSKYFTSGGAAYSEATQQGTNAAAATRSSNSRRTAVTPSVRESASGR
jgi:hypothetical protein